MAKRHHEAIRTNGIYVEDERHLPLDEAHVEALAASIKEIGLIEPIIVCRRYHRAPTVVLVAGRHRLEAHKRLKLKTIPAIVEEEDSPEVERWRKLAEIDENLIRRTLTASERAKLIGERKAIYEEVHPETRHGGDRKSSRQVGDLKERDRFTADTARKSGKSERAVQRDAARGAALGEDLDRIAGTSLDKGSELDALVGLSPEQRAPLIERAVAGENVSAQAEGTFPVYFGSCHGGRVVTERTSETKAKADRAAVKQPKPMPDVTAAADRAERGLRGDVAEPGDSDEVIRQEIIRKEIIRKEGIFLNHASEALRHARAVASLRREASPQEWMTLDFIEAALRAAKAWSGLATAARKRDAKRAAHGEVTHRVAGNAGSSR
jgi:ParB family chromosome partitioning protein